MITDQASAGLDVIELPQGGLSYRVAGPPASSRPPVVFVHGLLVDSRLWEPVAERLAAEGIRSYAPTLPLGAHERPMNADADLTPQGVAGIVRDFIAALGLSNVTIVGNDTGGAICQLVLGGDTSRIGAAVLTNCDAFDAFPPRALAPLFFAGRHPALVACLLPGLRSDRVRNGPLGFGPLASAPLDVELTGDWVRAAGKQGDPPRPGQVRARSSSARPTRRRQPVQPVHRPRPDPVGRRRSVFRYRPRTAAERCVPARQPRHGARRADVPAARAPG